MINKQELNNIIKISSLYIAATIGAGFASGKELFIFFTSYGERSQAAVTLSGILFLFSSYIIFNFISKHRPDNIDELFKMLLPARIGKAIAFIVLIFMFAIISIMISGMANIVITHIPLPYQLCTIIITVLCILIVVKGIKGIVFLSQLITPMLIIGIFTLCRLFLNYDIISTSSNMASNIHWSFSSILYLAYNVIISTIVIIDVKYLMISRKIIMISAFVSSLCILVTSSLINEVLLKYHNIIENVDLPMLTLAQNYNPLIFYLWSALLFIAMLSTAISTLLGCLDYLLSFIRSRITAFIILIIIVVPLSFMGFSKLILTFYPIFGFIGIILILSVLYNTIKSNN